MKIDITPEWISRMTDVEEPGGLMACSPELYAKFTQKENEMTKLVRIENADTSSYKVVVEIWDKGYPEGSPDTLAQTIELNYPTAMTGLDCYLTSTRYLVVKEA